MFMMNKKRKKTFASVIALILCLGLVLSVVAGYFSFTGYNYNYNSLPTNSSSK